MGTYYRYVNFTRGEFVSLSDLRDGGDKENAVLYCAPAIAWLLIPAHYSGDGYRGRWRSYASDDPAHDVRVVSDASHDFCGMEDGGTRTFPEGFVNITPGLLQSLRRECQAIVQDYQPRLHDVALTTHLRESGRYTLLEEVSAACKCGWKVGPIHGNNRDETLLRIVSDHVSSRRETRPQRAPEQVVYRTELSADDRAALVEAIDAASAGREAAQLRALRDRLLSLTGSR